MYEILLSVTFLKSRLQGINPVKLSGLHPKKRKTTLYLGYLGLRKFFQYLNNDIRWKYENTFKFKADITLTSDEKVSSSLDKCLLDEDIGGFAGSYLFDDI
jgi:hypothetical protein